MVDQEDAWIQGYHMGLSEAISTLQEMHKKFPKVCALDGEDRGIRLAISELETYIYTKTQE
jgi:hypothetical protein